MFLLCVKYELFCSVITNFKETCFLKLQNKHAFIDYKSTGRKQFEDS